MIESFTIQLKEAMSDPRLERYRKGGNDLEMLTNYFWNMALADALYCPLAIVEVMLRNTIHDTLSTHFGMTDWYDGRGFLEDKQAEDVEKAKDHIRSRSKQITPERIISNLTFGFWVTILSATYNDRFWRAINAQNIKIAFPHALGRSRKRKTIMNKYYAVNNLRNLAFHYEPIFDLPSLLDDHRRIYDGIGWIDPNITPATRYFDRFPDVHRIGKAKVRTSLKEYLGIANPKTILVPMNAVEPRRRRVRPRNNPGASE